MAACQASLSFTIFQSLLKLTQPSCSLLSPSPPAFSLSQHQGLFQWVGSSNQVAKVLELQLQHQSFQWIFRTDFLQDWLVWFPCCPRDFQESSPTPQLKSISSSVLSLLMVQLSHPYMTTAKTRALTIWPFVGKVPVVAFFSFLFCITLYCYMYHSLFIYLFIDGYLTCFSSILTI